MFFCTSLLFPLSFNPRTFIPNRTLGILNAGAKTAVFPSRAVMLPWGWTYRWLCEWRPLLLCSAQPGLASLGTSGFQIWA